MNYTLTARRFATSNTSAEAMIISELLDQYYEFENSMPCDSYSFIVEAVTAAGTSASEPYIFFTNEICSATTTTTLKGKCPVVIRACACDIMMS